MVFGKEKGSLWSLLTRGLYSEGIYRVNSLGGDFERSLSGGGPCSGVVSRSGLTVHKSMPTPTYRLVAYCWPFS